MQPVVALAAEVRRRGHDVRLCVPPNFIDWVGGLGFTATPIGIAMRQPAGPPLRRPPRRRRSRSARWSRTSRETSSTPPRRPPRGAT
ncbi:hypothetical protein [Sorangium sp. So ce1151]|uniref:hypothetical protein n=1 Tax=Sorangium sp. So ce1151 TaxID=3133332 RepID=UPI003F5E3A88